MDEIGMERQSDSQTARLRTEPKKSSYPIWDGIPSNPLNKPTLVHLLLIISRTQLSMVELATRRIPLLKAVELTYLIYARVYAALCSQLYSVCSDTPAITRVANFTKLKFRAPIAALLIAVDFGRVFDDQILTIT